MALGLLPHVTRYTNNKITMTLLQSLGKTLHSELMGNFYQGQKCFGEPDKPTLTSWHTETGKPNLPLIAARNAENKNQHSIKQKDFYHMTVGVCASVIYVSYGMYHLQKKQ